MNTKIMPFINKNVRRFSHHHSLNNLSIYDISKNDYYKNNIVVNLLGEIEPVDKASWEIKTYAQERMLVTANIVYDIEILSNLVSMDSCLEFVVNRCYTMSCSKVEQLSESIIEFTNFRVYNLYVMPYAKNRFNTDKFKKKCCISDLIIYPLAASEEIKRRDINFLIDSKDN